MQKREIIEGSFGDLTLRKDAEAAVEGSFDDALLLENVGEGPVTHHFGEAVAFADSVGQEWAYVGAVGDLRFVVVGGIVLGPDERNFRVGRRGNLLVHLFYSAADHFVA